MEVHESSFIADDVGTQLEAHHQEAGRILIGVGVPPGATDARGGYVELTHDQAAGLRDWLDEALERAVEWAAQPEADRAPFTHCSECGRKMNPDPARATRNGHARDCSRHGYAADALRSEQGQSRDDTVTLAEALRPFAEIADRMQGFRGESPLWAVIDECRHARDVLARFGAGRAEGEDRD